MNEKEKIIGYVGRICWIGEKGAYMRKMKFRKELTGYLNEKD